MALYNGFSTQGNRKKFRLTDFELVKRDLQNHFAIRKGEKLMDPDFGTTIWDMLFEPLNEDTRNLIVQEIKRIIAYDPRISANNVIVTQYDMGIQIELDLIYISTNQVGQLLLNFDNRTYSNNRLL